MMDKLCNWISFCFAQTESPWNGKARGGSGQQNRPVRRPCTELLKYLTATDDILLHTKASDAKSAWGGPSSRDKSSLGLSASSTSSSPSSSSTSSFSSLSSASSCSSSTTSKKKSAVPSQQQQQSPQQHHQRGESRAAGECIVAGHGAGKWQRCSHDDGVEDSEGASVPVGRRTYTCGHTRPKQQHGPPNEEGRPPGDVGRLAAARFIRYMHSYSLPPREVSHSCEHCREAAGATQARQSFGKQGRSSSGGARSAPQRHITVMIKKREVKPGHPLLSQLLTSKQRPTKFLAQLHQLHSITPSGTASRRSADKRSKSPAKTLLKAQEKDDRDVSAYINQAKMSNPGPPLSHITLDLQSWVSQPNPDLDLGFGQELGWPNQGGFGEDVDHDDDGDGVVVDDDDNHVMGSPAAVLSRGPTSPFLPDTSIAEPSPPCIIQGQGPPHRQALSEHPDDQGHLLLGNHDCIPPPSPTSGLMISCSFFFFCCSNHFRV